MIEIGLAERFYEDEARAKLCPLIQTKCEASGCALWHTLIAYSEFPVPVRGYGYCTIPQKSVAFAIAEAKKARAA